MNNQHQSVLLHESIQGLALKPDGIYVDGTFGRGGHSRAILAALGPQGRLFAIDKDLDALAHAKTYFQDDPRFQIVHGSFAQMADIAKQHGIYQKINGILLDLGVSSPQLDNPARGFSFMHDGPLDMRMDATQSLDAASFIQKASVSDMTRIFKEYGEERFAARIARAIEATRAQTPLLTTAALAAVVKEANPQWEKHKHPATRVFQAIRIHINRELTDLHDGLKQCMDALDVNGRLVVISFHSLEDRIVKRFMRDEEQGVQPPRGLPVRAAELATCFKRVGKSIKPSLDEVTENVRSRSAILRIGEKIA